MGWLNGFFGRKKSLSDLSLNDLQGEKIRLEEQERRTHKTIEGLEGDKAKLFKQGVGAASERERLPIARKIKELDEEAKEQDRRASLFSKQIRIVNRLVSMKRKEHELKEAGLWSLIAGMDATNLETMLTEGKVGDEMQAAKIKQILGIIETDTEMSETLDEDDETMNLVALMQKTAESGRIEEGFAGVKEVLHKAEEQPEAEM